MTVYKILIPVTVTLLVLKKMLALDYHQFIFSTFTIAVFTDRKKLSVPSLYLFKFLKKRKMVGPAIL